MKIAINGNILNLLVITEKW